jgi:glycosyl hydrolase family 42 (putative beta-galactosidase)
LKTKQPKNSFKGWFSHAWKYAWDRGWRRRIGFIILAVLIVFTGSMYGVAQWYIQRHNDQPLVLGASFVPSYAQSFGLDPKDTLNAMLSDLKLKQVRLVSYWEDIEPTPGKYDFSQLDWQFAMANKYGAKVSLSIGLRQPRWPECHQPDWSKAEPKSQWQPQLFKFMGAVIDHYKNNPALSEYELENEFFLKVFGLCTDFDRSRLINEYNFVKAMDTRHQVIVSRSDNWVGIPVGQPTPDEFAISVYKRVWDATFTHRYFEYPLPAWFYASLAGSEELLSGKDMIIHELQAEPWTPNGKEITQISVKEMYKSMDPQRLKDRINYGEATGMRTIDLWGAEWWYYMKVKQHDPGVWNAVKDAVAQADADNAKLARN